MAGLVIFALASLAGGVAESGGLLIAARAAQGLGAAILAPASLALLVGTFPEPAECNRAMGAWAAVGGAGGAAGALLGGILTDGLGWEWVLWVNVPIGLAAATLAPSLLDESRATDAAPGFDLAGAASVTAAVSVLVYALIGSPIPASASARTLGLVAVSVVLLAAFVALERRATSPLVPFAIFRAGSPAGANLTLLIACAGMVAMFFFGSLYMQQVLGYAPLTA